MHEKQYPQVRESLGRTSSINATIKSNTKIRPETETYLAGLKKESEQLYM